MGEGDPLLPPLGPSDLESSSESDLIICRYSSPLSCDSPLIDSASLGHNFHHHMEYSQFVFPFGTINPPRLSYFLDFELPLDEAILEAMTMVSTPWEDLLCGLCFLPFWETF
jgi:hypothetical protein